MVEDKIRKYHNPISFLAKCTGVTGMIIGATGLTGDDSTAMAIYGGSALLTGYAIDAVNYMKGYFNERLDLEYKKLKAGELEKRLEE